MLETLRATNKDHFFSDWETLNAAGAPAWLNEVRKAGAARLSELDFPGRRLEEWRFTNVAPILSTPFRTLTAPEGQDIPAAALRDVLFHEADWTELVFVNGYFAPRLSSAGVLPTGTRAGSLAEAIASGETAVRHQLNRLLENGNIFNALNSACMQDGACIILPANQSAHEAGKDAGAPSAAPIHLVHVTTDLEGDTAAHPRNLVILGRCAEAVVVESCVNLCGLGVLAQDDPQKLGRGRASRLAGANAHFNNSVTEVFLEPGARLHWHKMVREGATGYHLATMRVRQDRDSYFRAFTITLGGRIVRNEVSVALDGEGAEASLNGLYLTEGRQLVDNAVTIEHAKPHCKSWIGYKGVLDGESHAVFSGKIKVRRNAQKTDSKQLNNNLLLSDQAAINTKPLLEIFADDVKCTHGATVGRHPKEVIFYFRSRGMSEAMARAMLTYGFADAIVNQIEVAPLRRRLDKAVYDRYSPI